MSNSLIALIGFYSAIYGVDPKISLAVARVESNFNTAAIGKAGEIGLFQVKPKSVGISAKLLKYPEINIKEGIKYLAWNKKNCKHKVDNSWLVCYNMGIGKARGVKDPKNQHYYKKVMYHVSQN